jgi:hypothetical protein
MIHGDRKLARFDHVDYRITGDRRLARSVGAVFEKANVAIVDANLLDYS